jgi:hypothetical protein
MNYGVCCLGAKTTEYDYPAPRSWRQNSLALACQTLDGEELVCRFSYGGKAAYILRTRGQGYLGRDA